MKNKYKKLKESLFTEEGDYSDNYYDLIDIFTEMFENLTLDNYKTYKIGSKCTIIDVLKVISLIYIDENKSLDSYKKEIDNVIYDLGFIPECQLYRGCSDIEKKSILKTSKSNLNHSLSFSDSKNTAKLFGNNIITIESSSIELIDLTSMVVAFQHVANDFYIGDYTDEDRASYFISASTITYEYLLKPIVSWLKAIKMDPSVRDKYEEGRGEQLEEYSGFEEDNNESIYSLIYNNYDVMGEFEWIIPENTKFIDIDKNKLIFKI